MSNIKKLMMSGAAGGGGLDVDEVFSTYLFTGNGTSQTLTNGLDLAGEGGLIWTKRRDGSANHQLYDTARGIDYVLNIVNNAGQYDYSGDITSVNSDGFSVGYYSGGLNYSGREYATWSFRKTPKFFDVVTYTGNGVNGRQIAHNLGCEVGMLIVKRIAGSNPQGGWHTYHRGATSGTLRFDTKGQQDAGSAPYYFGDGSSYIHPTSSVFTVYGGGEVNESGSTYVAYLWAHNDGDGEFGPDGDQDIIKCGSYAGNSSADGPEIDLGFEPQFVMLRNIGWSNGQFIMYDSMRGLADGVYQSGQPGQDALLYPAQTYAEAPDTQIKVTPTGFKLESDNYDVNNNFNYIYIAIRRGSLFPPESATDVFAVGNHGTSNPAYVSGFPVDMAYTIGGGAPYATDRLRGSKLLSMFSTTAEAYNNNVTWDWQDGYHSGTSYSPAKAHMWKRAPGFFDVVTYTGNGSVRTISHNLGAVPEMMWVTDRDTYAPRKVYHKATGNTKRFYGLTTNQAAGAEPYNWNNTSPTDEVFTLGGQFNDLNVNGNKCIAYLFATLPGISKVGSYTGNGSSQTINCGFTSGARFVLTKRADSTGNWNVWDAERGIVAGNDPRIKYNDQYGTIDSGHDYIDPHNSGFIVNYVANDDDDSNINGASYIFYAIA